MSLTNCVFLYSGVITAEVMYIHVCEQNETKFIECILILQDLERFLCVSTNNSIENILIFQNYIYFFLYVLVKHLLKVDEACFFIFIVNVQYNDSYLLKIYFHFYSYRNNDSTI